MNYTKSGLSNIKIFNYFLMVLLFFYSSYEISIRPLYSPDDTYSYYSFFNLLNVLGENYDGRFEFLFVKLTRISIYISENYKVYFAILFFCLNLFYIFLYREVKKTLLVNTSILLFFCFLFLSGWYYTSAVNGIRQGLATPLAILSVIYFTNKKYIKSLIFMTISAGFHLSTVLIIPFVFLTKIRYKNFVYVFALCALFYPIGVNELIVKFISDLLGIGLYESIKYYLDNGLKGWIGFHSILFIYSIFWFIIFHLSRRFVIKDKVIIFEKFIMIYGILCMIYFIFGFGNFSNRYAFTAWCFIPIVQYVFFQLLSINKTLKFCLSYFLLIISFFIFMLRIRLILS